MIFIFIQGLLMFMKLIKLSIINLIFLTLISIKQVNVLKLYLIIYHNLKINYDF
jgi:hypothetical protein